MAVSRVERVAFSVAGFGDALTRDLARGDPRTHPFFDPLPPSEIAARIDARTYPRQALADLLENATRAAQAPAAVLENIQLLRDDRALVVATGQQAGFLGGPLYTMHKALSAVAQARAFSAQLRRPVVPLFWLAADDHDHGEIDHAYALNPAHELLRLRVRLDAATLGCSACDQRLDPDPAATAALEADLAQAFGPDAAKELLALYTQNSFSQAFAKLFYRWLGDTGIVLAPSDLLRTLPQSAELLERDLAGFSTVARLVQDTGDRLREAGYEPGFSPSLREAPHFFIATHEGRLRAALEPYAGDVFRERSAAFETRGIAPQQYTRAQLESLLHDQPERFSASAVLRPVLQQSLFPVLAAVLGPGEIAYWAQLRPVHAHFGAVWPLITVRHSLTLLDAAGERTLRKLGLEPGSPEMFLNEEVLRNRTLTGGETGARIKAHAEKLLQEFDALHADVRAVEGGLDPLFSKARERIAHELSRIAEKTAAAIHQREGAGLLRVRACANLIRPRGELQERVLSTGNFLLRFPNLATEILEHLPVGSTEHRVLSLD